MDRILQVTRSITNVVQLHMQMSNNRSKGNKIGNHATFKIYCSFIISLYKTTLQKKRSMLDASETLKNMQYFWKMKLKTQTYYLYILFLFSILSFGFFLQWIQTISSSIQLLFLKSDIVVQFSVWEFLTFFPLPMMSKNAHYIGHPSPFFKC